MGAWWERKKAIDGTLRRKAATATMGRVLAGYDG